MMLRLAKDLTLPLAASTETILIVGKRGSGKSSTATRFAEQLIHAGVPIAVLDPVDVWWGLKAGADGSADGGLPVYVFGGRHSDLPLEPTAGTLMADVIVDERINVVMCLRGFTEGEKAKYVADFADRLYRRNREPLHLFCEEGHRLMPQTRMERGAGENIMLSRMLRLFTEGRTSGIGLTAITQRAARLHKDATTQAEILLAHRLIGPQDVKAVEEWIKYHHQEDLRDQVLSTLPELKTADCWVWAPDFPEDDPVGLRRVHVLAPETFDSRKTPKAGERVTEPKQLAPVDLDRLRKQMAATIERAKQEDPKALRAEIARLRQELSGQLKAKASIVSEALSAKPPKVVKVPVLSDAQAAKLLRAENQFREAATRLSENAANWARLATDLADVIVGAKGRAAAITGSKLLEPSGPHRVNLEHPVRLVEESRTSVNGQLKLGLAERKILSALVQHPDGRSAKQLAVLTGYAVHGGGFGNALGNLRRHRLIEGRNNDLIRVTSAGEEIGRQEADPLPPPGEALFEYWMRHPRLGHAEREILRVLNEVYPQSLPAEEVAQKAISARGHPYAEGGGGFGNAVGKLRTLKLIEGYGDIRLVDTLVGGQ